jgi:hypothetical protein
MLRQIVRILPAEGLLAVYFEPTTGRPVARKLACLAMVEQPVGDGNATTTVVGMTPGERMEFADATDNFVGYCWSSDDVAKAYTAKCREAFDAAKAEGRPVRGLLGETVLQSGE